MYSPYAKVISNPKIGAYGKRTYRYANPRAAATARRKYRARRSVVPRTMGPFSVSESKYFDSYISDTSLPEGTAWTGTELDPAANTLFAPVEGSDINNRIGRKVSVYKISIRGVIYQTPLQDGTDPLSTAANRLILYMDTQTNGTQAQGEDLMGTPGAATTQLTFCTFQNLANVGRFRVLRDIILRPAPTVTTTDGANTTAETWSHVPFKMNVRFRKPIIVKFNATNGGTVGDIVDNSFHIIGQRSTSDGTGKISYQCRTYYKDN